MRIGKLISTLLCLTVLATSVMAQSTLPVPKGDSKGKGGAATLGGRTNPMGVRNDTRSYPVEYAKPYSDSRLEEMEKAMKERDWNSEDTAWKKACTLDTKEAYQKYIAMYPYGPHRGQADKRMIDLSVDDVFKGSHGKLPGMNHVEKDDDSPTSTICVENATDQILTVYYSGPDSRSVRIAPRSKSSVTLRNGYYRIAASVTSPNVRPYAGSENFGGGRYEVGYCIVYGGL